MNNKIIIIGVGIISGISLILLLLFFLRPTIVLEISPNGHLLTIDKKTYDISRNNKIKLAPGEHTIKVEKNGYNNYEETVKLSFGEKKNININLSESNETLDRKKIIEVANNFAQSWYNYEKQTNREYLEKLKPYLTEEYYQDNLYLFTQRQRDFIGQSPLSSEIEKTTITYYNPTEASVDVALRGTERNKKFDQVSKIELVKINNNWLINYSKTIR